MTRFEPFGVSVRLAAAAGVAGPALVDGPVRWDWTAFDRRIDVAAEVLARWWGVGPGVRVALLAGPSAGAVVAVHAIARLGGVVAPIPAGLTATEWTAAAAVVDPALLVHAPELAAAVGAIGRPAVGLDALSGSAEGGNGAQAGSTAPVADVTPTGPDPGPDPGSPAAVVLTSGTTGQPKGVVLSSAALQASAEAWLAALPPATGWLLAVGLAHVAGLGIVWRAALSGVPLVAIPRPDPAAIVAGLGTDPAPSHVSLVPTSLARVLDHVADAPPPATLRAVLLGGGPVPPELVVRAVAAGWPVVPTYGLSEAGSGVTALPSGEAGAHPDTAGRPLPTVHVRIDGADETGEGEILVDGPALFAGYLGDADATAAAFTPDGWLRTGDIGRLDADGRLVVVDRRTDRIVCGGENVSPAEIEAVLAAHPAIAEAAVVGRRDAALGQVPVAAIVIGPGVADPADEALESYCRRRLARFKVPAAFIRVDALPRTPTGKLRRADLRASLDQASLNRASLDPPSQAEGATRP